MNLDDLRSQLEEDLAWRQEELRQLRNSLLGSVGSRDDWSAWALRSLLVMQYAHLEGFTQGAFTVYVEAINQRALVANQLKIELVSSAMAAEFKALRTGDASVEQLEDTDGFLLRRAKRQVSLIRQLREVEGNAVTIVAEHAVSLEMNLGSEVLKRNLYLLGIPADQISLATYRSLEFIRRNRNDIAHGSRRETIEPGLFEAHWDKCWQYMEDVIKLITRAVREEWFRVPASA